MLRRSLLLSALLVLVLALVPTALLAQRDFSSVQFQSQHVAGPVHVLISGVGGNIGVSAGDDGLLIIDDQFAPLAPKIRDSLAAIQAGTVDFLLNTHFHGDHTGGNTEFGGESMVVAHDNVRRRLSTEQTMRGQVTPAQPKHALPVITFAESASVHFNGEEIRLVHLPNGHTDGDSIVIFTESNVVHMGDHFFAGRFPFIDLEHGGNAEGFARNIDRVVGMIPGDAQVIPGHGPLSTVDDLRTFQRMLHETIATVRAAKTAGKSLEEAQAAGFSAEWADWGSGFINTEVWAQIIYASLN